jgi:hypothetical protein
MKTVPAQVLYELREKEEVISGTDLHDLFRLACDGDPSPPGAAKISVDALFAIAERDPYYREFIARTTSTDRER